MKVNIGEFPDGDEARVIDVHVDDYDTWNLDHTLALIIHPALIKLKENSHSCGMVDDSDVPEELQYPEGFDPFSGQNIKSAGSDLVEPRWNYILDELIWTFDQLANPEKEDKLYAGGPGDFDKSSFDSYHKRTENGLILFGKYFRALWT